MIFLTLIAISESGVYFPISELCFCFVFTVRFVILCVVLLYTALRDHRIELVRASWQELTIRIGDVSLSDEGQYTCSLFTMPVKTTKAFLTVLGEHVCFGPVSTGQLLVANSSRSDCMNTCTFLIIVYCCCFFNTHLLLCRKIKCLHYILSLSTRRRDDS